MSDLNVRHGWDIHIAVVYCNKGMEELLFCLHTKATKSSIIKHGPKTIYVRDRGG